MAQHSGSHLCRKTNAVGQDIHMQMWVTTWSESPSDSLKVQLCQAIKGIQIANLKAKLWAVPAPGLVLLCSVLNIMVTPSLLAAGAAEGRGCLGLLTTYLTCMLREPGWLVLMWQ